MLTWYNGYLWIELYYMSRTHFLNNKLNGPLDIIETLQLLLYSTIVTYNNSYLMQHWFWKEVLLGRVNGLSIPLHCGVRFQKLVFFNFFSRLLWFNIFLGIFRFFTLQPFVWYRWFAANHQIRKVSKSDKVKPKIEKCNLDYTII